MRLGAASGRRRLADRPRCFEIYILIAHLPRPALIGNCCELFPMVAAASRSIYGAVAKSRGTRYAFEYSRIQMSYSRCGPVSSYYVRSPADWLRLGLDPLARKQPSRSPDPRSRISRIFHRVRRRRRPRGRPPGPITVTRFNCCRRNCGGRRPRRSKASHLPRLLR
jgi:hypothetical protein